jgi:hypothetical protein
MRDHDNGNAAVVQLLKNCHDFNACAAVEIPRWLVGKQHLGIVNQCSGDCDPLLLATGKLAGMMIFAAREPD